MAGKEALLMILDIGKSMSKKCFDTDQTRLNFGIESMRQLIRQKLLFNVKKDELGIILMGDYGLEAENIRIFTELNIPSLELLNSLMTITADPTDDRGDIFVTIDFAIEEFVKKYKKTKWNKKIYLITDGESPPTASDDRIKEVIERLKENDIKVNIICIGFYEEIDDEEQGDEENVPMVKNKSNESQNQIRTKERLKILQKETENVKIFSASTANEIYHQFRKKKINPTTKYRGELTISPNLSIDVMVYAKTVPQSLPSLKKYAKTVDFSDEPGKGDVTNERVYYIADDPDKKPIEKEFITKAYYYGSSLVPVSQADEARLKSEEQKCLKVIGFTDAYRVPRHFYMAGCDVVVPNPTSNADIQATLGIVNEMLKMNKVIIARFVFRNNSTPKLVVLTPHISKKGPIFYLNILPTVEEIRDFQFESLPECSQKQEEFMGHFIDSLDLEKDGEEQIKPSETYNPMLQYFYKCVEHKALADIDKKDIFPEMDEESIKYMKPDPKLFENNKFVTFFNKAFPIVENETPELKKKRIFWKDVISNEFEEKLTQERIEEKLNAKKPESKKVISAITPIEDFKEMINNKNEDLTVSAMNLMIDMINKFIRESFKGSYYVKAIDCIKTFRDCANDEDEVDLFNDFLIKLKEQFPKEQFLDFWLLFCDNKITLISQKENSKSKYDEKQCQEWLNSISKKDVISSTVKDMGDLLIDID
jgi:ATP-dependent DNA helicase 2 subunit 2